VFSAHGGKLFRFGSAFVAWKTASAVASMERTMRLQAKLIPRKKIFAILTRTLTFCWLLASVLHGIVSVTYNILRLLLFQ
jgi:hypothetical protein